VKNVRAQLKSRRGGADDARLLAVAMLHPASNGRNYRLANATDEQALDLFGWVFNAWKDPNAPQEWPIGLPRPSEPSRAPSSDGLADEITLMAIGYLILHEIAHIILLHGPTEKSGWSIDQEKEADQQAVEWFLAAYRDSTDNQRIRRGLAIATALIKQVAEGMFTGDFGGETHPPKWQRLDQVLRLVEDDPQHPIFAFVAHLLPFYRSMSGKVFAPGVFDDFLHAFDSYIDQLSKTDNL
jgi:hypothetical protein